MELEGVLVDTREARRAALLESLTEEGVVLDATEFNEVAVGMTPRQGARALLAPAPSRFAADGLPTTNLA